MANDVFANGREVSCKKADGKSTCSFPDVCMTPPENPATPPGVPIPYPNTGFASDTTDGSRSVQISGKEIMLKNKSYFKKSTGDEAGCAAKKGVVTSVNRGKVYFIAWSMDVKAEGENVVRHLDMTTHNHASPVANESVPWPYADSQKRMSDSKCTVDQEKEKTACSTNERCPGVLNKKYSWLRRQLTRSAKTRASEVLAFFSQERGVRKGRQSLAADIATATAEANNNPCVQASRCHLRPYKPNKRKKQKGCCPGQTPHHIPPASCFKGVRKYNKKQALCVCLEGTQQHVGSHGKNHAAIDYLAGKRKLEPRDPCSIAEYNTICAKAVAAQCGCEWECIEQQLNESLKPTNRNIKHYHSGSEQMDPQLQGKLNDIFKAPPAPPSG
jgi:hypothetical protein